MTPWILNFNINFNTINEDDSRVVEENLGIFFKWKEIKNMHKDLYLLIRFLTAWDLIYCCFTAVFTEIPFWNPLNAFD